MRLKLKDEYKGVIITLTHKDKKITLDTTSVKESDYEYYYKNGFKSMFTRIIKFKGI